MTAATRLLAVLICIAGIVDPAMSVKRPAPLPVEVRLPGQNDPDFAEAVRIRGRLLDALGPHVTIDSGERPRAVVAVGNASVDTHVTAPVYAVSIPRGTQWVRIDSATPLMSVVGQRSGVRVRVSASGTRDRTTKIALASGATQLGETDHRWSSNEETHDTDVWFPTLRPGLTPVHIVVSTEGLASSSADIAIPVHARPIRVLFFEPRPSWSGAFVRQAVEGHEMFDASAITRTSTTAAAHVTTPNASLASTHLDDSDAIVVSGPDAVTDDDVARLERFVKVRGGTLILLPDAAVPDRLREVFAVPPLEEILLDRPAAVTLGEQKILASELLVPRTQVSARTIAGVAHGANIRPAVFARYHGNGQVVFCGTLDAWRFRGGSGSAFGSFWKSLIADAGSSAPPRIAVQVDPLLVRRGDDVTVRVSVRETEWTHVPGGIRLPSVAASVVAADGVSTPVRLWPGHAAGEYIGRFTVAREGNYNVRISADDRIQDAVLAVRDSARPVHPDLSTALTFAAKTSGGDVVSAQDLPRLESILKGIARSETARRIHPLRSSWWIVPFAGLLGIEWIRRRRVGLR